MRAKLSIAVLIASLFAPAFAQAQPLLTEKKGITGFAAQKIIQACPAQAAREHYPSALAVTDSAGNLLSYEATNAQMAHTGLTAQLKAKTAAKFRRSTAELYERGNK